MNPLQIRFGVGLSDIPLGMQVSDFLSYLSKEWPRLKVEIVAPVSSLLFEKDVIVDIKEIGIIFHFLPKSQRLYLIDIYDICKADFVLKGETFGKSFTSNGATTFASLQKCLGPSFPGKFVDNTDYLLQLNGAALLFVIPDEFHHVIDGNSVLPEYLPNSSSPALSRVYIFP